MNEDSIITGCNYTRLRIIPYSSTTQISGFEFDKMMKICIVTNPYSCEL